MGDPSILARSVRGLPPFLRLGIPVWPSLASRRTDVIPARIHLHLIDPLGLDTLLMRRFIDVLFSVFVLTTLSPILLLIALMIALDSRGGPLYGGLRAGKGGRVFRMWKFRTMIVGADLKGCITGQNDQRITGLGRFLRKSKLDELPQFINVLTGDMTLVGPRPEAPDIVSLYTPAQRAVLTVKPGVTGRVQLEAGDESESIPESVPPREYYVQNLMGPKIRRDLAYLRSRSPLSDAQIVVQTATAVFRHFVRG
jgi:lipopolysaccharide/colanic/teichoic acid biosynthesis glycosyltransferase